MKLLLSGSPANALPQVLRARRRISSPVPRLSASFRSRSQIFDVCVSTKVSILASHAIRKRLPRPRLLPPLSITPKTSNTFSMSPSSTSSEITKRSQRRSPGRWDEARLAMRRGWRRQQNPGSLSITSSKSVTPRSSTPSGTWTMPSPCCSSSQTCLQPRQSRLRPLRFASGYAWNSNTT